MTQAYPLQWPDGRPRTKRRVSSSFKVTPRKAYDELRAELSRFGVKAPVVSSNCPLRISDGTPYADALSDRFEDPGVAVYFTRKDRLVCIACDTYETPFENIRALGLSVNAMRDMDRWGAGQVLDQAFEGFTALPPPDQMGDPGAKAWWVVLGVKSDATVKEAEAAWKALCRTTPEGDRYEINAAIEAARKVSR